MEHTLAQASMGLLLSPPSAGCVVWALGTRALWGHWVPGHGSNS